MHEWAYHNIPAKHIRPDRKGTACYLATLNVLNMRPRDWWENTSPPLLALKSLIYIHLCPEPCLDTLKLPTDTPTSTTTCTVVPLVPKSVEWLQGSTVYSRTNTARIYFYLTKYVLLVHVPTFIAVLCCFIWTLREKIIILVIENQRNWISSRATVSQTTNVRVGFGNLGTWSWSSMLLC